MLYSIIIKRKAKRKGIGENMKYYVSNEEERQEVIARFKKRGFVRIENSFWYETWKSPYTNDLYEIERV